MSGVCSQVRHMCPPPIAGRGPGASRCEQNGLCQYVPLLVPTAPKISRDLYALRMWLVGIFLGESVMLTVLAIAARVSHG